MTGEMIPMPWLRKPAQCCVYRLAPVSDEDVQGPAVAPSHAGEAAAVGEPAVHAAEASVAAVSADAAARSKEPTVEVATTEVAESDGEVRRHRASALLANTGGVPSSGMYPWTSRAASAGSKLPHKRLHGMTQHCSAAIVLRPVRVDCHVHCTVRAGFLARHIGFHSWCTASCFGAQYVMAVTAEMAS